MKDTIEHASDIIETHWNRKREPLEIIKAEILFFRSSGVKPRPVHRYRVDILGYDTNGWPIVGTRPLKDGER